MHDSSNTVFCNPCTLVCISDGLTTQEQVLRLSQVSKGALYHVTILAWSEFDTQLGSLISTLPSNAFTVRDEFKTKIGVPCSGKCTNCRALANKDIIGDLRLKPQELGFFFRVCGYIRTLTVNYDCRTVRRVVHTFIQFLETNGASLPEHLFPKLTVLRFVDLPDANEPLILLSLVGSLKSLQRLVVDDYYSPQTLEHLTSNPTLSSVPELSLLGIATEEKFLTTSSPLSLSTLEIVFRFDAPRGFEKTLASLQNLVSLRLIFQHLQTIQRTHPIDYATYPSLTLDKVQDVFISSVYVRDTYGFLFTFRTPQLRRIHLEQRRETLIPDHFEHVFSRLAASSRLQEISLQHRPAPATIQSFHFKDRVIKPFEDRHLRPLSSLEELRVLQLGTLHSFNGITDAFLQGFASSFPRLTEFNLGGGSSACSGEPLATMQSLLAFAEYCPLLKSLSVPHTHSRKQAAFPSNIRHTGLNYLGGFVSEDAYDYHKRLRNLFPELQYVLLYCGTRSDCSGSMKTRVKPYFIFEERRISCYIIGQPLDIS